MEKTIRIISQKEEIDVKMQEIQAIRGKYKSMASKVDEFLTRKREEKTLEK